MFRNPLGAAGLTVERPWATPRNLIAAALVVNVAAALWAMALPAALVPGRIGLLFAGLVLALAGVNHRLREFREDLEERGTTAGSLALAAFAVLLAYLACDEAWDSFRLALGVFVGACLTGAVLVLLSQMVRRLVIVLLVFFHFGGILTAVFSVQPPGAPPCWLSGALWTYVYRPYLQFMYLNNAYHFYSPEPGPQTLLWFYVTYDDPKVPPRWIRMPQKDEYSSRLSYIRHISMTESTVPGRNGYPLGFFMPRGPVIRRFEERGRIPYHPQLQADPGPLAAPDLRQYREPSDLAKMYIASYARHVARDPKSRDPDRPDVPVKAVKVYRVEHVILTPAQMAERVDPWIGTQMLPIYVGEFNADGELQDPGDPLLYWLVPILEQPGPDGRPVIKDYVVVHAQSHLKAAR
jgi:hypothetical protein